VPTYKREPERVTAIQVYGLLCRDIRMQEFVSLMQAYDKYIRPHQGISGLTPAQMANIPIDLSGNRLERIIGLAINF